MEMLALLMFAALILLLLLGYPVAFTLGAVAMVFGLLAPDLGLKFFEALPMRIWGFMDKFTLLAVPLFIFMGVVLEKSGLAEDLLETMALLFGRLRGGLAVALVIVGGLLAATTGVVGATVVTMTVIALPTMLKNGYQKELSCGTIAASGTLGQLIPPSVILILLGDQMGVPVGQLFAAAVVPGLLLIGGFVVFIMVYAALKPHLAPLPKESVQGLAGKELGLRVLKSLLPPLFLMVAVLGTIFFGIASPMESAGFGALGAMLLSLWHRRLNWVGLRQACDSTLRMTSMVFMILLGATAFGLVFRGLGGDLLVHDIMTSLPGGLWGFLLLSMLLIFILGFFLDFLEICFIVVPILGPIAVDLDIGLLWFAILIAVNLQTSFLTPPFGFTLFYLKAAAPAGMTMQPIYRGVIPFIAVQACVLLLLIVFPGLVEWLPDYLDRLQGY